MGSPKKKTTVPDDRILLSERDFNDWNAILQSPQKSQFWKSRCYDKEPYLMAFNENAVYRSINHMGRKLRGLFDRYPWFALLIGKELEEFFLMGLYFGERRFHCDPNNLLPDIDYPEPRNAVLPSDEFPEEVEEDEIDTDIDDADFE